MPKNRFVCVRHFHNIVATSAGTPTCRECGLGPTAAERAVGIKAVEDWERMRLKAQVNNRRSR